MDYKFTVMKLLLQHRIEGRPRTTQQEIAQRIEVGRHERHEKGLRTNSSKRKVRQIISDLRQDGHAILSDRKGYWISEDQAEIDQFLDQFEARAKASAAAYFRTVKALGGKADRRKGFLRSLFD